jgi:putative ABC transport system permease protein
MKLVLLVLRNLRRRSARTVLGIASALALLVLVESLSIGMERAMDQTEAARTLIVYRKNRYCPQASFLPESYRASIERIDGVEKVLPVKVFLNNCRASLDLVTFHGGPIDDMLAMRGVDVYAGDVEAFRSERDGALVGRQFAERRRLSVGDRFAFGGIIVNVRGFFSARDAYAESLVLTHLEFLQRAGPVDRLGTVTQFEVRLTSDADPKLVAAAIDETFRTAQEPTDTRPRIAFLESATRDLAELLRIGRWLALACVVVVLALVANTVSMGVQERVRELGVLRAIGFRERHVGGLVLGEAFALAAFGGALGVGAAILVIRTTRLAIGSEGISIALSADPAVAWRGIVAALVAGVVAGAIPAIASARRGIVTSLAG